MKKSAANRRPPDPASIVACHRRPTPLCIHHRAHRRARILSWNVNGLRAAASKGFLSFLHGASADVVALQEVRAQPAQLDEALRSPPGYASAFFPAAKKGYSGVALLSQTVPDEIVHGIGDPAFDDEGRVISARFGALWIVCGYFPHGAGKNRDNSRIPYKLAFTDAVRARLRQRITRGERVLLVGDLNVAHRPIDLARPKQNEEASGFRPEERAALDAFFDDGWVDTFRAFESGAGHYSWWSQRFGVREKNVGWRIDYVLASPAAQPFVRDAFILRHVPGSDHAPVGVDVDVAIFDPEARPG